jgi:hypothetical protein
MVYIVTKAPIGWSLSRDRDGMGAYASREATLEAATAAGVDAGIVTACKSTCPDQSSMKSKSRYRGLTVGSLTTIAMNRAMRVYYKLGESASGYQLVVQFCSILELHLPSPYDLSLILQRWMSDVQRFEIAS